MLNLLFGPRVATIESGALVRCLNEGQPPFVLDVRTPPEFRTGHIPGSHLIPLGQLVQRLAEIPKDRMVVTVCRSGHRSMIAAQALLKQGYEVKNLHGGMSTWTGPVTKD